MGCDPHFGSFINSNEASIIAPLEENIRTVQPQRQGQSSIAEDRVMVSLTNTFSTVESLKEEVSKVDHSWLHCAQECSLISRRKSEKKQFQ